MGVQEYALLIGLVIVLPLVIAVVVTLWTLEQARMRSRKNRPKPIAHATIERTSQTTLEDVSPVDPGQ